MDGDALNLQMVGPIRMLDAAEWDQLAGTNNPFVSHAFLAALERGGAVGGNTGWEPAHIMLRGGDGQLMAAMPLYIKHHSYGEYVFDHSWAKAFEQAGGSYYPKLLSAVPFTPANGPRLLAHDNRADLKQALAKELRNLVLQNNLSSAHINFLHKSDAQLLSSNGWLIRSGIQFHWHNENYHDFDNFLTSLSSRKRKNIRKERASVKNAGVRMLRLNGDEITQQHIDQFYRFYLSTIDRKWGGAYLTHAVFEELRLTMADKMLLVMAEHNNRIIGGALNFIGEDTLYGRNWGAHTDIPYLHFEACYYQAIEYAIKHGLIHVEAGAQGFHKVQRGYMPVTTYSAHYIAHNGLRTAVARFLKSESQGVHHEIELITRTSPFKSNNA